MGGSGGTRDCGGGGTRDCVHTSFERNNCKNEGFYYSVYEIVTLQTFDAFEKMLLY